MQKAKGVNRCVVTLQYAGVTMALSLFILGTFFPHKLNAAYTGLISPFACEQVINMPAQQTFEPLTCKIPIFNLHLNAVTIRETSTTCGCIVAKIKEKVIPAWHGALLDVNMSPSGSSKGRQEVEIVTDHGLQTVIIALH